MERLFVKICGITNLEDLMNAVDSGADAVGINFFRASKRYVTPGEAAKLLATIPSTVQRVGVFVDPGKNEVEEILKRVPLDVLQFSGNESPSALSGYTIRMFKAIHVVNETSLDSMRSYRVDAFLLDAHSDDEFGGTGKVFDWAIAEKAKKWGKVILAGGLNPENVSEAVRSVKPYGVDVSSGVETRPGKKDQKKIREFILRARQAAIPIEH